MLFSVIIPVYNIEDYVRQCLDSVLNQTFSDYEIILIDDGSTDNSGKICDEYAGTHKRIQVIHQKNQGQAHARNRGIEISKGDYVLFLDGDDYWYHEECLWKLSQTVLGGKYDVVAYRSVALYSVGKRVFYSDKHINKWKQGNPDGGDTPQNFLKRHLKDSMFFWYPWFYAFSRTLFADGKLRFPCNRKYEDVFLVWRILLRAESIAIHPDIVYVYRKNRTDSTTYKQSYSNLADFFWVIQQNIKDIDRETGTDIELRSYLLSNFSKNYILCCTLATYLKKPEKEKMIAELKRKKRYVGYAKGKKYILLKWIMKGIGFEGTLRILHFRSAAMRFMERWQGRFYLWNPLIFWGIYLGCLCWKVIL